MYHPYRKDNIQLRTAIFQAYSEKCAYCGRVIQQRDLHVDHILPVHPGKCDDVELTGYLEELNSSGFVVDSIENYLPACPACNIEKSNSLFSVSNLRFYHEKAKNKAEDILKRINNVSQYADEKCSIPEEAGMQQNGKSLVSSSVNPISKIDLAQKQEHLQWEPIYGNRNHMLAGLFVHHSVVRTIGEEKERFDNMIDAYQQSCWSNEHKMFLLLGDYGVGKSTSLKMLASKYNNGSFLYISLKDVLIFSDNIRDGILDYCQRKYQFSFHFSALQGDLVLLLDGFDELQRVRNDSAEEEKLFRQINALTQYDHVKVILSSRSTAFINSPQLLNVPTIYMGDFDDSQIDEWIGNWKIINPSERITITLAGLKERNLLEICRNKLILYMVARVYNDELLEARQYTKAYVYKCFFDWTINGKFREDVDYTSDSYSGSTEHSKETYRRILQDIALVISQNSTNEIIDVKLLKEKLSEFQRQEIDSEIFDFTQHLFTRHFFSTQKNGHQMYVEFSHKSLREYIYAEKIFFHLRDICSGKELIDQIGEWYQFGRNQRLSKEVFAFLEEMITVLSVDDLLKIDRQMFLRSSVLLVANGTFKKYIDKISDNDKSILNISESYYRSLVLSVMAGIINHICYNLIQEKYPDRISEAKIINCEMIYKICDYYLGMSTLYFAMYPIFLQFVKYIQIFEKDIANVQYIDMNLRCLEIVDGKLLRGIIQKTEIERVNLINAEFSIMKFSHVEFNSGAIEACRFESCMFDCVVFRNITFRNVHFDLIREGNVEFQNCTFEDTTIGHYLKSEQEQLIKLDGEVSISL